MKVCPAAVLSPATRRELQGILLFHQVVTISGDRMTLEGILEEMTISEVDSEGMTSREISEGMKTSLEATSEGMILGARA